MRILVLSSVFPNAAQPTFGVFVRARVAEMARSSEVVVVAPVPWFPLNRLLRGRARSEVRAREQQGALTVHHPRFLSFPGLFKCLDGLFYFLSILPHVWRLRRSFAFDLIDAHFTYPTGMAACLLGKVFRCPVSVTLRGTLVPLSRYRLRRPQLAWTLRRADRILSVSESLAELAVRLGAPAGRIRVIPNGVDTATFAPGPRAEARAALDLPPTRPVLLSVGILSVRKGHQRVLAALPEVLRHCPDLLYVVVGGPSTEGDTGPLLRRTVEELGLADHVRLVGARPPQEVARWLAASDVFCLATSNEGRPNAVMEALACGVPVVTTRVGGNAEIIDEGRNGLLVPLDEPAALTRALITAFQTDWNREAIAGPWQARSWDRTAAEVLREFASLLGTGSHDPARAALPDAASRP
ncbi:MAG: glycosyltransferase [Candidatus Rokuibacteriota bacterium]